MSRTQNVNLRTRSVVATLAVVALATSLVAVIGAPQGGAIPIGPPDHLAFTLSPPDPTQAGVTFPVTVQVQDLGNALVPVSRSIALHITPGTGTAGATLTCAANPVVAPAGSASFTGCFVDKVGPGYKLTAVDATDAFAANSAAFDISAGPATQLAFSTQPPNGTLGMVLVPQPVVQVQDAFGNPVGGTPMVSLALTTGSGSLQTCPGAPAIAGVATFVGCKIDTAGIGDKLTATSTGPVLAPAISAPFDISDGIATKLAFTQQPGGGTLNGVWAAQPKVSVQDVNGAVVTTNASTIHVAIQSNPGGGTLAGCADIAAVAGVATFSGCNINLSGVGYTLTATTVPALLTQATSAPFNVGPLHLVFGVQPGNGIAGSTLSTQPVVTLQDAANHVVDDSLTVVTLTKTVGTPALGGPGALTCASNPVTFVHGVAAFSGCTIDTVGTGYQLTAASVPPGISAVSAAFNVVGPATKLVFTTEPGDGTPGNPLSVQPVVKVEDAVGNVEAGDNSTVVTLAIGTNPSTGVLTCAPVTAVAGVAVFTGCKIDKAGSGYTLTATSNPVLTSATSAAFNVSAGPQRIFGPDAIDTSIAVSKREFPTADSATAVVLARSDYFSDALAGGPLAAVTNAPLLITPGVPVSSSLDPRVQAEIQRVLVPAGHTVYVLGGTAALAPGIDTTLPGLGYTVVRVAGANQFSTAVAIAGRLGDPSTVFEATGLNFLDALSAVPAAINAHGAILLTNGTIQAPETAVYLAAHPPTTRYAIGGPQAAAGADPTAIAVFGEDGFGTSAAVADVFFADAAIYGVATGLSFHDALSGGVFMATGGRLGPVLLVNTHTPLPPTIPDYLQTLAQGTPGYVFGGPAAVGNDVVDALEALVG